MRFFVTGATGFVGSHVVRELEERGHECVVFHRPGSDMSLLDGRACRKVAGDIFSAGDLARAMEGADGVFHVAGNTSWFLRDRDTVLATNVDGTRAVVGAMKKAGIRRGVLTSSVAAIGFTDLPDRPADEETPFNWPAWMAYPESKREGERIWFGAGDGLEMVAVNPPTVMGPGDARMSVGVLFREVAKRRVPRVSRGGFTICDARDVARGHVLAFEKGRPGDRYIVGGADVRPSELMERIASRLGVEPARMRVPVFAVGMGARSLRLLERLGVRASAAAAHVWLSTRWIFHSSEKARRELGYTTLPLDTVLEDSILWYREKGLV